MIRSRKMRDSARGQECTLNIAGVCNYNPETVVFIHLPDESHGMAKKADDISGCDGCSACHDAVDRRVRSQELESHREWYLRRAMVRTWRNRIERGVIRIA